MPGDFREMFDLRKLDEHKRGEIEFVLTSPAYAHSFKPYIEGIIRQMEHLWRDRSEERKAQYNDDFLGGGVTMAEGLLKFFELLIQEADVERIHNAMGNLSNDDLYDRMRDAGRMRPVVGLDQSASPSEVPPEEDY